MRLYFATDVHGSETCWRKFLNAAEHYKADVLVLGGDMTGKALVPIIDDGDGKWHATLLEVRTDMTTEEEVAAFEDKVIRRGYYPFRTDPANLFLGQMLSTGRARSSGAVGGHHDRPRRVHGIRRLVLPRPAAGGVAADR